MGRLGAGGETEEARAQVLLDREIGEERAAVREMGERIGGARVGREAGAVLTDGGDGDCGGGDVLVITCGPF